MHDPEDQILSSIKCDYGAYDISSMYHFLLANRINLDRTKFATLSQDSIRFVTCNLDYVDVKNNL